MSKKFYAVARGRRPGIYESWFGPDGAQAQVKGFPGAVYRGFASFEEARQWLATAHDESPPLSRSQPLPFEAAAEEAVVYTDGSSLGNPGPGGFGVVVLEGGRRLELAEGYRLTTNNRMELMACIAGLKAAKSRVVTIHSDSRYVVDGFAKGWAARWRSRGWRLADGRQAENSDLWEELLRLCAGRSVSFVWVEGHAGHAENERCDELAVAAAKGRELKEDAAYLKGRHLTHSASLEPT